MPNAKDVDVSSYKENILVVGETGSGKTSLIRTLPGKVFAYLFDPNAKRSIAGADIEYEEFLPDSLELDVTIKGFNKGSKSDRSPSRKEPMVYLNWVEDLTKKAEGGFFKEYDWVCFDSLTFLQKACFDRQMYLNNRYGGVEELADYRIVGSKISDVFRAVTSEPINVYCTGHIQEWQDELTKRITTEIRLSGQAKTTIPLMFTQILLGKSESDDKHKKYVIQTRPEKRGLQCIRSTWDGLEMIEDVTIQDMTHAEDYGIGNIMKRNQ